MVVIYEFVPGRVLRVAASAGSCVVADGLRSVVMLGQQTVVCRAQEADVARAVVASHPEWVAVMELDAVPLGATSPLIVDETATASVALVHRPAHSRWNVS